MTLGQSGGRSRRNPTGPTARVRATPRERAGVDHPRDDAPVETFWVEPEPFPLRQLLIYTGVFLALTAWVVGCVVVGVAIAT